jgi:RimJ/RimL family protein N-acetyltransferase
MFVCSSVPLFLRDNHGQIAVIPMDIRSIHPSEAATLANLLHTVIESLEFYLPEARAAEIAIYTPAFLANLAEHDPAGVLVAIEANTIVGFCISYADDGPYWLAWFGATIGYRRRGLGLALLEVMHTRRQAAGVHKIWCDSRTANLASRACLAGAGYREICTIPDHWFRQDYVLLERYL